MTPPLQYEKARDWPIVTGRRPYNDIKGSKYNKW